MYKREEDELNEQKLKLLKEIVDIENSLKMKLMIIDSSQLQPYSDYAYTILERKDNIDLRMDKTHKLIEAGILKSSDLDRLYDMYVKEYEFYLYTEITKEKYGFNDL